MCIDVSRLGPGLDTALAVETRHVPLLYFILNARRQRTAIAELSGLSSDRTSTKWRERLTVFAFYQSHVQAVFVVLSTWGRQQFPRGLVLKVGCLLHLCIFNLESLSETLAGPQNRFEAPRCCGGRE